VLQKAQSAGANGYTPSWVKYRYGAWYLQPKLWKKHASDEPLRDPKEPKNKEVSEAKSKSLQLVCTLETDCVLDMSAYLMLIWSIQSRGSSRTDAK